MLRISNIKANINDDPEILVLRMSKLLKVSKDAFKSFDISKKSIDARDKSTIKYVYSIDIEINDEWKYLNIKDVSQVEKNVYLTKKITQLMSKPPVIVGSGPAGLFAGLIFAEAGCCPIILERGKDVDNRKKDIKNFWKNKVLNENSNIQFGEGGAGTFSDGKLTTGVKDKRISKVINELIEAGAPDEIKFLAKPHMGTDKLIRIVKNIRNKIIELGGIFYYNSKFVDFYEENNKIQRISYVTENKKENIYTDNLILAIGHSARDTMQIIYDKGLKIQPKSFAVGVRIEHSQKMINESQFGKFAKDIPSAEYKLNVHLPSNRGVYTFCMCPGGFVVGASSEKNMVVTNGMSLYARNLENANSALLVSVSPLDFPSPHPLAGIEFQRNLERKAFDLGGKNYFAPVQTIGDFLNNKETKIFKGVIPSYKPGVVPCDLRECLPNFVAEGIKDGILLMNKKLQGFSIDCGVLTGVETRSSSPITICRDNNFQSNISGVFPCGEGAGFAGGIMSAAVDGIKCAEKSLENIYSS